MTNVDNGDVLDGWGARLAAARTAANMTQSALALEAGVTLSTIQRWEAPSQLRSSRRPSEVDQRRLADILGVPVSDLFPRSDREAVLESIAAEYDNYLVRTGNGCS